MNRVNYQVLIWRQRHIPDPVLPDPMNGHIGIFKNGAMKPKWTDGRHPSSTVGRHLEDIVAESYGSDDDDDDDDDDSSDEECMSSEESDSSDDE